jgi:hypothetical protein
MKKLLTYVCAATMAFTGVAVTAGPTIAAPIAPIAQPEKPTSATVEEVQYRRYPRRGFYRYGGGAYYNGHRGYREYRRGYRRHNDFWFPAGAFIAGAIIGGALATPDPYYAPRRVYRRAGGNAHVEWCYNRYRSYRAYDNTFQPYNGPRQQCYSPYS